MIKVATIVGARPQFIKAATVSRIIRDKYNKDINEIIIHTGQHFDENMSGSFFSDLDIPEPKYNLEISGGRHGSMTGRMLNSLEDILIQEKPDWVVIYGDTNSTLAGALAASKLHIPIVHVEAGLRSFNMKMPEEINRILSDRVSTLLFCPTDVAVDNLAKEGISKGVYNVGDVMYDASLFYKSKAKKHSEVLRNLDIRENEYILVTCHRAENTNAPDRLGEILSALNELSGNYEIVFPLHPRTKSLIDSYELGAYLEKLNVIEPVPFLDMIALEQSAKIILTDSGGVQKEAFFYNVPCITMRDETEWVETIKSGANVLVGASKEAVIKATNKAARETTQFKGNPYGKGDAAEKIVELILNYNNQV